jgi:signal peptide peptidase SppA
MLPLIANKIYNDAWCITREAHQSIQRVFEAYCAGENMPLSEDRKEGEEVKVLSSIAIVEARGVIGKHLSSLEMACGGLSVDALVGTLNELVLNDDIDAIIINFNSPGGVSTGVFEAGRAIKDLSYEKPIFAFSETQCASAGYWLASQCSSFFATQSSKIGSVGVYIAIMDDSMKREKDGYKLELFKSGKYKALGLREFTEEDRDMLQASVNKLHNLFKAEVTADRDIDEQYLEGQCFDGDDAAKYGLVDHLVMDIREVINLINTGAYE